jgi:hypothetical protein
VTAPTVTDVTLRLSQWRKRADAHQARVGPWVTPRLDRRARGATHPVDDFLFTYYSFRPSQLLRWHPGVGVTCEVDDESAAYFGGRGYVVTEHGARIEPRQFLNRLKKTQWIRALLRRSSERPAALGCFGLHEWAMVYRRDDQDVRHASWPLRLGADDIAATVEEIRPRCTHFDAFRFFTDEARPLNLQPLTREGQLASEQPGCLHVTMDLYKWAYKVSPLISSELVADCFELAREVRLVDMRASPYDLRDLGVDPICIETSSGRAEYVAWQREFVERAKPLRSRLLERVDAVVECLTEANAALAS